jgi:hypothetical protein
LPPDLLPRLKWDPDWRVRFEVASRIALLELTTLAEDEDVLVREMAQSRLGLLHEKLNGVVS